MDGYKNYIVPGVALLLILAWFFVIQPQMTQSEASGPDAGAPVPVAKPAEPT